MSFSKSTSRVGQLSMALACTLLASGGFIGAGYVGNAQADEAAAAALATVQYQQAAALATQEAEPPGYDAFKAFAARGYGIKMSFAEAAVSGKKPANTLFDLTDPNGNTPQLGRSVSAMLADLPQISAELMSQVRKDILAAAYQGLGHPYVWGGTSFTAGWDCSGFVQWAYGQAGVALPRTEQWLPMVRTDNPQPGDIVVQNPDGPNHWSHIGIYVGNGMMISALNPSVGTFLHAPGAVSASSTFFTMPAFAAADERARADAERKKAEEAAAAATTPPATTDPATTPPATTDPATTPPVVTPPTTPPVVTPPTTAPGTTPAPTDPATLPETAPSGTVPPAGTEQAVPGTPPTGQVATEPASPLPLP